MPPISEQSPRATPPSAVAHRHVPRPGVLGALLAALCLPVAAQGAASGPVSVSTQARIDVDAQGRVIDVVPDPSLPQVFHQPLKQHLAAWRFEAPVRDGVAVPATTYARLGVCAMPDAKGGMAIGFSRASHGPGADMRMYGPMPLPPFKTLERHRKFDVIATYDVMADGDLQIVSVRANGPRDRGVASVEKSVQRWLEGLRFEPERLAGTPVVTRMSLPVHFDMTPVPRGKRPEDMLRERLGETCESRLEQASRTQATMLSGPLKLIAAP